MVLQTDESELDSDVTVQNRGKSQLRVDSSFRITRHGPQKIVPFGVFTLYLAVSDLPRSVFPCGDLCILFPLNPCQRHAHSLISEDATRHARRGDYDRVAICRAGEHS